MRDTIWRSADCGGRLAGGDRLRGPGRQMPIQAGPRGIPVLATISAMVPAGAQVGGVVELGPVDGDRPADPAGPWRSRRRGRGTTRIGSARLRTPTPRSASSWIRFRVSRTVAAHPVQGVHHDHVTGAGAVKQGREPGPVGRGAGLLVQVDPLCRDPRGGQCVDPAAMPRLSLGPTSSGRCLDGSAAAPSTYTGPERSGGEAG